MNELQLLYWEVVPKRIQFNFSIEKFLIFIFTVLIVWKRNQISVIKHTIKIGCYLRHGQIKSGVLTIVKKAIPNMSEPLLMCF